MSSASTHSLISATLPEPNRVAGLTRDKVTSWERRTSRSMACANPTASASRSSGACSGGEARRPSATAAKRRPRGGTGTKISARAVASARSGAESRRAAGSVSGCSTRSSMEANSLLAFRFLVHQMDWLPRHDRRDGMLIDELGMSVTAKENAEVVEPGDDPLQLDPVDEKNGQRR